MRGAAVVALLLAALCVASAARLPDDDLMNLKDTLSNTASVQVGGSSAAAAAAVAQGLRSDTRPSALSIYLLLSNKLQL
jgi:hypothetical protein